MATLISESMRTVLVARIAGRLLAAKIKRTMHAEEDEKIINACVVAAVMIVNRAHPPEVITVSVPTDNGPVDVYEHVARELANMRALIPRLIATLQPFANMYRDNDDPDTVLVSRGVASENTTIHNWDVQRAFNLLREISS